MLILSFDPAPINMSYCLIDSDTKKVVDWKLFQCGTCTELIKVFESIPLVGEVIVLYEHQPPSHHSSTILHKIVGYIEMYFTLREVKLIKARARSSISFMSEMNPEEKMNYQNRKKIAIEKCRKSLENNEDSWINYFNNGLKLDDISDSYIQAMHYIEKEINSKQKKKSSNSQPITAHE